jgi:hypothetical protein
MYGANRLALRVSVGCNDEDPCAFVRCSNIDRRKRDRKARIPFEFQPLNDLVNPLIRAAGDVFDDDPSGT